MTLTISPLIRFDRVTVAVRGKVLLSNVSFAVERGEKAVFRGRSGSGKSTVLKALLGLYPVVEGAIYFQGRPLDPTAARDIRTRAAYIGQEPVLGAETVREALLLPFRYKAHRGHAPAEALLIEMLSGLRLPGDILDFECRRMSGGEKQRVALARALLLRKNLYLLDEVTSALDGESKQAVLEMFADSNLTVLSVAHDPDWIARCGVIYDLQDGRLVQESRGGNA
jgi:putative ABC transport system ATP-binding protein